MNIAEKSKILLEAATAKIKIAGLSDDELYQLGITNGWIALGAPEEDYPEVIPEVETEKEEEPVKRKKSSSKKSKAQKRQELLDQLLGDDDDGLSEEEINEIQEGLEDIKKGRIYPIETVAKELGIVLR